MEKKLEQTWYSIKRDESGNRIKVDLIKELIPYKADEDLAIHIGTDAQAFAPGKADYVTCVIIHGIADDERAFARIFYHKDKGVTTHSLWDKLYNETMASIMSASEIAEQIEDFHDRIVVHVDANPKKEYASNNYVKQLAGMVMGYGFKHLLKPDSWASSHAADHIVKNKHKK